MKRSVGKGVVTKYMKPCFVEEDSAAAFADDVNEARGKKTFCIVNQIIMSFIMSFSTSVHVKERGGA